MRALLARVARAIRQECQIGRDDRVAVAVSGGSDSVALVWLLHELAGRTGPALAGLVHVNHQLRGTESDADEQFCRQLAARLAMPIVVRAVDVRADARARRVSLEVAARAARYRIFAGAAADLNATVVATGHTRDDQAETVLLRLFRGAGTRGLSGIRARRGLYARPLLSCRRDELRAYLVERAESWRDDASNADASIPRNRIRHELMPVINAIAPNAAASLARLATLAADDEAVLAEAAIARRPIIVLREDDGRLEVDAGKLAALPGALARRLVRELGGEVAPAAALSARHLEAVCRLAATDKPVGHLDLPGLAVTKRGGVLFWQPAGLPTLDAGPWPSRRLDVPGSVAVPEIGVRIEARAGRSARPDEATGPRAVLQTAAVRLPLAVRNRRPGDRLRPLGAPGSRKLQDVFVDRKVPRTERDAVPLVVDADDRIVWVVGLTVAHGCRVTAPEDGVLILEQRTAE